MMIGHARAILRTIAEGAWSVAVAALIVTAMLGLILLSRQAEALL